MLCCHSTCLNIHSEFSEELIKAFSSDFARRYLPSLALCTNCRSFDATVLWLRGEGFQVISAAYSDYSEDLYVVSGSQPEPYVNEAPVFFLAQVLARAFAKKGYILLTDSVFVHTGSKGILLLGYPHTGKSTIATILLSKGCTVVSTENTIVQPTGTELLVHGGTRMLVFDPKVKDLYGIKLEYPTKRTKHGYEVLDLDSVQALPKMSLKVNEIYVLHTSFTDTGANVVPVKGRKIGKTAWYFALGLLKGLDYYEPAPLDMPLTSSVLRTLRAFIEAVEKGYAEKFYEVFGSPFEVAKLVATK